MRRSHCVLLIVVFAGVGSYASDDDVRAGDVLAVMAPRPNGASDPESAVREFVRATLLQNEVALKRYAMPHDDLAMLLQGKPVPKEHVRALGQWIIDVPIKRLEVGEVITVPGGYVIEMDDTLINEDRQQLMMTDSPVPLDVIRIEGVWKVDPRAVIAARKAAQKAVEKNARERNARERNAQQAK